MNGESGLIPNQALKTQSSKAAAVPPIRKLTISTLKTCTAYRILN